MKTKHALSVFGLMTAVALVIAFLAPRSHAGYPMIADLPNQYIQMNGQTGVIPFRVTDDLTPANQLTISSTSDTPSLVPADAEHIILGGSNGNRTVQVIPVKDQAGTATITITVTDTDGETNQDSFEVEVSRQPRT
jgi:hypothetical protein